MPGANHLAARALGFAEFTEVYPDESDFKAKVAKVQQVIQQAIKTSPSLGGGA